MSSQEVDWLRRSPFEVLQKAFHVWFGTTAVFGSKKWKPYVMVVTPEGTFDFFPYAGDPKTRDMNRKPPSTLYAAKSCQFRIRVWHSRYWDVCEYLGKLALRILSPPRKKCFFVEVGLPRFERQIRWFLNWFHSEFLGGYKISEGPSSKIRGGSPLLSIEKKLFPKWRVPEMLCWASAVRIPDRILHCIKRRQIAPALMSFSASSSAFSPASPGKSPSRPPRSRPRARSHPSRPPPTSVGSHVDPETLCRILCLADSELEQPGFRRVHRQLYFASRFQRYNAAHEFVFRKLMVFRRDEDQRAAPEEEEDETEGEVNASSSTETPTTTPTSRTSSFRFGVGDDDARDTSPMELEELYEIVDCLVTTESIKQKYFNCLNEAIDYDRIYRCPPSRRQRQRQQQQQAGSEEEGEEKQQQQEEEEEGESVFDTNALIRLEAVQPYLWEDRKMSVRVVLIEHPRLHHELTLRQATRTQLGKLPRNPALIADELLRSNSNSSLMGRDDTDGALDWTLYPAVVVGPWYLEWNPTGLVIPKRLYLNKNRVYETDVESLNLRPPGSLSVHQLAKIVSEFNSNYVYSEIVAAETTETETETETDEDSMLAKRKRSAGGRTTPTSEESTESDWMTQSETETETDLDGDGDGEDGDRWEPVFEFEEHGYAESGSPGSSAGDVLPKKRGAKVPRVPIPDDASPARLAKPANCATFVRYFLTELSVDQPSSGPLERVLNSVERNGAQIGLVFEPSEKFALACHLEVRKHAFNRHRDLDEFVRDAKEHVLGITDQYFDDFSVLKMFDRVFWARYHMLAEDDPRRDDYAPLPAPREYDRFGVPIVVDEAGGCFFRNPQDTMSVGGYH